MPYCLLGYISNIKCTMHNILLRMTTMSLRKEMGLCGYCFSKLQNFRILFYNKYNNNVFNLFNNGIRNGIRNILY